ncbi:MAG: hypothetical protein ABSG38_05135 [Spirochaetia bacterium]
MGRETQDSPAGEQKLERYGVWVKIEPRTVMESQGAESSFELTDLEALGAGAASRRSSPENTITLEEEKLLDELDTELGPSEATREPSIPEEEPLLAEDEELPDISEVSDAGSEPEDLEPISDEELPELELEEELTPAVNKRAASAEPNEVEVTLSETEAEKERFEDLDALETELASVAAAPAEQRAGSSEILARIEDELRSIRADLTQLRSELSGMRKPGSEPAVAAPPAGSETQSGFFDEDEDETISLTGDELDNILNTAEITEEVAEAAPVEESMDLTEIPEESSMAGLQEDLLGLEPAESLQEAGAESAVEELPSELELEDLSAELGAPKSGSASAEGLPELDLEGIPEIETTEKDMQPVEEVGDLETLDLEEEPGELEPVEEPAERAKSDTEQVEELGPDVDLDALAAEAEALESEDSVAPVEDLEIGELEPVTEDFGPAGQHKEIEIPFENESAADRAPALDAGAEEVLEMEEAAPEAGTKDRMGSAAAIPDDLKDEIRTVLKYMDNLLEALPDEKIQEFAGSEYFVMYKKLFEDLGLGE